MPTATKNSKPCKFCGGLRHISLTCFQNPKRPIKPLGKGSKRWARARKDWFKANLATSYNCFYCGKFLKKEEITLDHYHSRSRRPDLRYELSNLVPCCWECNSKKGSVDGDDYRKIMHQVPSKN